MVKSAVPILIHLLDHCDLPQATKEVVYSPRFVCLSVCLRAKLLKNCGMLIKSFERDS